MENVLKHVGNTPLIELVSLSKEVAPVKIYGKAEWANPGGSVKDRPALNMVLDGEKTGKLTKDKIILDATSGNTGIAYAMIGAALNYKVKLAVPKNIGRIRQQILEVYGAELVLTDLQLGSDGAIEEAIRIYEQSSDLYFYPDQYNNPANWQAHYKGDITHFIAGLGTSGTFTGTGRRLKEHNADIQLISLQPDSPMHGLEGLKHMPTSIVPGILDENLADENRWIRTEDAQTMAKRLARDEGLLIGPSAGAAAVAALQIAREIDRGIVVAILADGGHKYLDMSFWGEGNP
ncbi:MAG: pyridoxal-phosphate dependent enzyme [Kiritimatiellae bacterium]|nr:pyridoxal-phosphate dependent enzyme [Kiritimatiellia bacterium]